MFAIEFQQVSKQYRQGAWALSEVSFGVPEGSFFSLLGLNGAGKTTLIGILSGLIRKTSGQILVHGQSLDLHPQQIKQQIGLMPQEVNLHPFLAVRDVLRLHLGYHGMRYQEHQDWVHYVLERLHLADRWNTPVYRLSGGMKRRLMLARALVTQPKIAILDEPTAGVDFDIRYGIYDFLTEMNRRGTTILLTTHYLEEVDRLCTDCALLAHGQVLQNTSMADLRQSIPLSVRVTLEEIPEDLIYPGVHRASAYELEVSLTPRELMQFFDYINQRGWKLRHLESRSQLEAFFRAQESYASKELI